VQFSLATRWQNARLQALGGAANATARVHQAFRRRSGGLVAGGKCATAKADAPSGRHLLGRCKIWAGPLAATFGSTTKLMELLKEVAPQTNRVALMFNPATSPASGSYFLKPVEAAAPLLKMAVVAAPVHNAAEIEPLWCRLRASRHRSVSSRGAVHRPHSQGRAVAVIGEVAVESARNVRAIGKRRASNFALSSLSH
jgi:hypothetical protein